MAWAFYQYPLRLQFTIAGGKPLRRLISTFLCPKIFIGSAAFFQAVNAISAYCPAKRAFILTDKPIRKLAETLVPVLQNLGFTVEVCDKAEPEPPIPTVEEIAGLMEKFAPDLIIAVGGGSAIDAAKAAWIRYERPDVDLAKVQPLEPLGLRAKAFFIAVPTTAGTGSECTFATVLTDTSVSPPRKIATGHPEIVPDMAVLMPELTVGMPPKLTAGTGLDVIAHAFEAFMNRQWANDLTDGLALRALKVAMKYLPIAYKMPENVEARYRMLVSATMAGLAFSNAGAALTHSFGHSLGKVYGIHHGVSVGVFVPYILQYYSKITDDYVEIGKTLDLEFKTKEECLDKLVEAFKDILRKVDVGTTIKELGIDKKDFEAKMPSLVKYAYEDPTVIFSVRPIGKPEFEKIFTYAYEGKNIDW